MNENETTIDEIGAVPGGFTFNQYLVVDDEPLMFHTGLKHLFPSVREAIARVIPVERLRWIAFSHMEQDECGALNELLAAAPRAEAACSRIGGRIDPDFHRTSPRSTPSTTMIAITVQL